MLYPGQFLSELFNAGWLINVMGKTGFTDIVVKGFDLTGGTNFKTLRDILLRGLSKQKENGEVELFEIQINQDTSVCYIGKAIKP